VNRSNEEFIVDMMVAAILLGVAVVGIVIAVSP